MTISRSRFLFNDTATTEIYPLSLHDALPISARYDAPATFTTRIRSSRQRTGSPVAASRSQKPRPSSEVPRSEEHTSELQSLAYLVCRLLLEKKITRAHV